MVEKLMNDILRTNSIKKIENIKQPLYMQSQFWGLRLFKILKLFLKEKQLSQNILCPLQILYSLRFFRIQFQNLKI